MLDAIRERFSCRSFRSDPVTDAQLREVLGAGFCAPSGHNARPWHFTVVTDQEKRRQLSEVHQYARMCARAPVVLVICADRAKAPDWWLDDSAAAIENILIQAQALGLGTCWIGIHAAKTPDGGSRQDYVRSVLDIPPEITVVALIALGHPAAASPSRPDRYEPDKVHWETW